MSRYLRALVTASAFFAACSEAPDDPTTEPPPTTIEAIEVDGPLLDLAPGEHVQLTARGFDVDGQLVPGRTFTWHSDAPGVAAVNGDGLVTAVAAGEVTISASADLATSGVFLTVRLPDVVEPVDHVTLDTTALALPVGQTRQLVAQPRDAAGQPLARLVTWSSTDPAAISVDATGLLTAHASGGADITATSEGRSATVWVDAIGTTGYTLAALGGSALPALLGSFTVTLADGSTVLRSVRLYDGWLTIDHVSQTYEATLRGVYTTQSQASAVPLPISYESIGGVASDASTGELVFTPANLGPSFTARWVTTGLQVQWQPDDRMAGASTFLFTAD